MARLSKGAQLRQQAAEKPKYTEAQFQQALIKAKRELLAEYKQTYRREWMRQNKLDTMYDALALVTCVPCEVLVDEFGWAPYKDERSKIGKFVNAVVRRVNEVSEGDLNQYAKDMYDKLGISFMEITEELEPRSED